MTFQTLPKPSANNKQVQEYLEAARKGKDILFVATTKGGWTVRSIANKNTGLLFPTREEALLYIQKSQH